MRQYSPADPDQEGVVPKTRHCTAERQDQPKADARRYPTSRRWLIRVQGADRETTLQPDGTKYAFSLSRIGGTSVACPTFAGIEADAQQAAGHVLGFANPGIYRRYGTDAFHDVTDHPFGEAHLAEVRNDYTNP